jgi:hypothetical protein
MKYILIFIILITLVVSSKGQVSSENKINKNTKAIVYNKLVELDKWYRAFSDTLAYSNEYDHYSNFNSGIAIKDSLITILSTAYIGLKKSLNLFDATAQKQQLKFINEPKNSTLFLGSILCNSFEGADLKYFLDINLTKEEIEKRILPDKNGNYYYRTEMNKLMGYQDFDYMKNYFLIIEFIDSTGNVRVKNIKIEKSNK